MAEARVPARCDSCGQTDDHPKMHYAAQIYHHDCIPAFVMDDLTSETYFNVENGQLVLSHRVPLPEENMSPGTRRLLEIREKAQKGTRGAKLLDHIHSLPPSEEAYGDSSKEQ